MVSGFFTTNSFLVWPGITSSLKNHFRILQENPRAPAYPQAVFKTGHFYPHIFSVVYQPIFESKAVFTEAGGIVSRQRPVFCPSVNKIFCFKNFPAYRAAWNDHGQDIRFSGRQGSAAIKGRSVGIYGLN